MNEIPDRRRCGTLAMTDFSIVPNLSPEHTPDHDYCVDEQCLSFGNDVDSAFSALEEVIPELKGKKVMAKDATCEEIHLKFIQNQLGSLIKEEKVKKIGNATDNRNSYMPFMDQVFSFSESIGLYGMETEKASTGEATRANAAQPLSRQIDFASLFREKEISTISVTHASPEVETTPLQAPTTGIQEATISTSAITSTATSSPLFVLKAGGANVSEEALQTTLSFIGSVAERRGLNIRSTQKATSGLSVHARERSRFEPYPKEKPREESIELNTFFGDDDEELIKRFSSLKGYITSTDIHPSYSAPVKTKGLNTKISVPSRKQSISPESSETTSTSTESNTLRSRSASRSSCSCRKPRLYHFLYELLESPEKYKCIEWVDKSTGVFKFLQSAEVARLWGQRKNKPNMKYENFARSLRTYVAKNILRKPRNKLVYQFVTPPSDDGSD